MKRLSWAALLVYFAIAFVLRNHQTFWDEGSNLDLAASVVKGLHLYRDLFENHFPLPVYLSAALIFFTGPSLPLVRLAVLLVETSAFFAVMRVSRIVFPVGLAAIVWALVSPYYFGNLLLYDNLAMIGGMALGVVVFAALARELPPSRGMFWLMAVGGVLVAMSNPFCGLVALVATGALWFAPQIPKAFVLKLWIAIAVPVLAYGSYLVATGEFGSFYTYVIRFNTVTYPKYMPESMLRLIGHQLLLFDLFNPKWLASLDPWRFDAFTITPVFDHWIFSGLFYRVAALLACLLFVLRRNYRTVVFLYLFVAVLPLRLDEGFHASPFVVFCLFLAGVLLEESWSMPMPRKVLLAAVCGVPVLLLSVSGARYVAAHAFQSDFDGLLAEARVLRQAAWNRSDVRLGHYPAGNYMYYLADLRPIGKFVDFYPWVAEVGRPEVDAELAQDSAVILDIDRSGVIWTYPNSVSLASEISFAKQHLVLERFGAKSLYVSPSLAMPGKVVPASAFKPGLYRNGEWKLALSSDSAPGVEVYRFGGETGDIPVTGNWDGSGKTRVGVYRPSSGEWILDSGDKTYHFGGQPGDVPVTGDWNGSGTTKIGIYRPASGEWLLDSNGNGVLDSGDKISRFGGAAGDMPVTGDWTGSGITRLGIVHASYVWILDIAGHGRLDDPACVRFSFGGIPGDVPLVGDWSGKGKSKPGIFRRGNSWLLDVDGNYKFEEGGADVFFLFGSPGDQPVTGAW
jgi:hypothetical protein